MTESDDLLKRLYGCPAGMAGWKQFEECCTAILTHLFVPPLRSPIIQSRTLSGIDRRDAIFPNRVYDPEHPWGHLRLSLDANLLLFEFKNYEATEIGKEEIDQTRNYLKSSMGRLAILCCNKIPKDDAYIRRNTIFSEERKVILFLIPEHLKEMCDIKDRGDEPADLIADLVDLFYLQHE